MATVIEKIIRNYVNGFLIMKVIMSEYSSGFSDYSYLLCNELAKDAEIDELIYLSDENNPYFPQIDGRVKKLKLFRGFKADSKHKKGSIRWMLNRFFTAIRNCKKRNKFVLKERPDSLLVQATLSKFDARYLQKLKGKTKIVLTVHDVIVPTKSKSWDKKSLLKMYKAADILVTHSATNAKQLSEIFDISKEKICIIPHGVKSGYKKLDKNYCKQQLKIADDLPVLLFYGSIRDSKGLDVLIKALKGVSCRLLIAGTPFYGETFDFYRALIDENEIVTTEFIEFTDDDFRDILFQACDYVVLPYKEFYSQSGVFMQAIQYHKPIIATNVSSFSEFVNRYKIGYIAEPDNVDDLRRVIEKALNDHMDCSELMDVAIKENCWEVAGKKYSDILKVN